MTTLTPHPLAVVYTVDQFCMMHAISRDTFERLVGRGELAAFKLGRRTYVAKEEAERWLRARPPARPPVSAAGQGGNQRHGAANRRGN